MLHDEIMLFFFSQEGLQNKFKSHVKEIEQEVRKRDIMIEVLQSRIQELQVF